MGKVVISSMAWLDATDWTLAQIANVKAKLTIKPKKTSRHDDEEKLKPIEMFVQKNEKIGVPREYYMRVRSLEDVPEYTISPGRRWSVIPEANPALPLRDDQPDCVKAIMERLHPPFGGAIFEAPTGWGKSLKIGTLVVCYNGELRKVEDLRPGDLLMGPDSTPRTVLSNHIGTGPMYRITPVKGDPWECNDVHILTLVHTETGEIVDIEIGDYLRKPAYWKHCHKQFQPPSGVDFAATTKLPVDPYFLGVWVGDGTKSLHGIAISKPDPEIELLAHEIASQWGLTVRTERTDDGRPETHHLVQSGKKNILLSVMRLLFVEGATVPEVIRRSSREERMQFFAGILDSDGYHHNGCYEVSQKHRGYADGIAFIARSLGFKVVFGKPHVIGGVTYYRMKIHGDFENVPMRIERKLPRKRLQKKCATRTGFKIESIGEGQYAGITLDGDGRFLLGDFTVTHNTYACLEIARQIGLQTVIIVPTTKIMDGWLNSARDYLQGKVRVGIIKEDRYDADADILVAMIGTLLNRDDLPCYETAGLVIGDEVDQLGGRKWSEVIPRFTGPFRIGCSARAYRKDGCDRLFIDNIGPRTYKASVRRLTAHVYQRRTNWRPIRTPTFDPDKVTDTTLMKMMCGNKDRNAMIVKDIIDAAKNGRKIIVFSHRRTHLDKLRELWAQQRPHGKTDGFLRGNMSRKDLLITDKCDVLFATFGFANRGYDNKDIDTVVLGTPIGDPEQAIGRGVRYKPGKKDVLVLDYVEDYPACFARKFESRCKVMKRIGCEMPADRRNKVNK